MLPEERRALVRERLEQFQRREKVARAEAAAVEAADADDDDFAPLPVVAGYIWRHSGEFEREGDESPCLPARGRVFLHLAGSFVGAVVLEQSVNRGQAWSPMKWNDGSAGQLVLAAAGVACVGCCSLDGLLLVRARCLSITAGPVRWSLSSW